MLANGARARKDRPGRRLAQALDVIQSQANALSSVFVFDGAKPVRARDIDGPEMQAVALRVFHQRGGRVEPHGLIVQDGRGERRQVMALQIRAGIGDQREAGRVRFGKSVQRERGDRLHDAILRLADDAVGGHAGAQPRLDFLHARFGALESHGAAQFLGFAAGEIRHDHGHAQQLLLKQRHTERPLQHRLQRRMQACGFFAALPAAQIRMQHLARQWGRAG